MINKHHNLSFNLHDDITRGFLRRKAKYNGPQLFYISTLLFINHKDYSLISSMPHKKSKYLLPHNHNSYRKKILEFFINSKYYLNKKSHLYLHKIFYQWKSYNSQDSQLFFLFPFYFSLFSLLIPIG